MTPAGILVIWFEYRWYISTRQEDQDRWVNQGDGTQMLNLQEYFLKSNEFGEALVNSYKKEYLVYAYSQEESRWGFQPVFGHEEYLYICEMPINEVTYLMTDERTHEYGEPIGMEAIISCTTTKTSHLPFSFL